MACILLLSLGQREFPVDTNVARIAARLGWIPLDAEHALEVCTVLVCCLSTCQDPQLWRWRWH